MSRSEVSIFNIALSKVGSEKRISQIGEDSREGEQAELLYEHSRDLLLQSHIWNFAKGRKTLSRDAVSPDFEFTYQYLLPADYLRALSLYNSREEFQIESNDNGEVRLVTNESTVNLTYIRKVTNPNLFSPLFTEALATYIAASMSHVIAGSQKVTMEDFKVIFKEAKRRDGQEGTGLQLISTGPTDFKNGFFK